MIEYKETDDKISSRLELSGEVMLYFNVYYFNTFNDTTALAVP